MSLTPAARAWTAAAVLALVPVAACATDRPPAPTAAATATPADPTTTVAATDAAFAQLQRDFDARLGVYAVDTGTGRTVEFHADERFAYASTFKALATAVVLHRTSPAELDRVVTYTEADLVAHSPVTRRHVSTGMPLRDIADAAMRFSDNGAANLLLRTLGGPAALDAALAEFGDDVTRVERIETDLNSAVPGDERDTTTPRALAGDLRLFAVGDALAPDDRAQLGQWLRGNTTGDALIRAAVPAGWQVGDRSGVGGYGTRNDIAVVWPPDRAPLVLAIMSSRDEADAGYDDALIAAAGRVVIDTLT